MMSGLALCRRECLRVINTASDLPKRKPLVTAALPAILSACVRGQDSTLFGCCLDCTVYYIFLFFHTGHPAGDQSSACTVRNLRQNDTCYLEFSVKCDLQNEPNIYIYIYGFSRLRLNSLNQYGVLVCSWMSLSVEM